MRRNSRWATSTHFASPRDAGLGNDLGLRISNTNGNAGASGKAKQEADLIGGFQELKRLVRDVPDLVVVPLPDLLAPFFAIIRSPLSTGPITSAALSSLHNFFEYGIINPDSISLEAGLVELSSTVAHCKFEASDSSSDEVVLLKIMTIIQDCLCGDVSAALGDVEVCEMLETVLTTCCQARLGDILRRSAEITMHKLVRSVFSRLHVLDPVAEETKIQTNDETSVEAELKMKVSTSNTGDVQEIAEPSTPSRSESRDAPSDNTSDYVDKMKSLAPPEVEFTSAAEGDGTIIKENSPTPAPTIKPQYGLPAILELLRVLVNVLDPNDAQHTDSTRLTVLGIFTAALEQAGHRITKFPSLEALIIDSGCKYLFQLARTENVVLLQQTLRAVATVMDTMRSHLKLHQELFLVFLMDRLAPLLPSASSIRKKPTAVTGPPSRSSTPTLGPPEPDPSKEMAHTPRVLVPPARGQTRDLFLESLSQVTRYPSSMVDLFSNYDCDANCENLFERLISFLTQGVYPIQQPGLHESQQRNAQYLCLDILLAFVHDMALRSSGANEIWPEIYPSPISLLTAKSQKELVLAGAKKFNAKPKAGIAFLQEHGIIASEAVPGRTKAQSLALFLKSCNRLDKKLLGEYLSKGENLEILQAFMGLFDFKDKPVAEALREMLETFRLPGEAPLISRIAEVFAATYFASGPTEIKNEDSVYVLVYSIIMLNTDQHNPQVRKRMAVEDYRKNLRGTNDGIDFSDEFLQNIYDSIKRREIVMPTEQAGQIGFEYAWKELVTRSRQNRDFIVCNSNQFDLAMFKLVWKPTISAIAFAFISFEDEYTIQRAIAGFRQCATLAGHFNLPDVFDFVVISLSQATNLLSDSLLTEIPNYPLVEVEDQLVTVSHLSVKFGTNFKGQLAAVVLFNIVNGNGNALREGWTQIFEMFTNLFLHSLLPTRMLQMEDFLGSVTMIPLRRSTPERATPKTDGGLLSALSSYLRTPYGSNSEVVIPEATDADIENTLCTIDCIASCRLDELYVQIMQLDAEALLAAVRALEALAHERTVAKLKQEEDNPDNLHVLPYDPASVFLLETMVSIACRSPQHIEDIWPIVFEHLSALISSAGQYSILLIERAVVCLLRLCILLSQRSSLRDQVYVSFDLLAGLPPSVAISVAQSIVVGMEIIISQYISIINSTTEWNLVFALLRSTVKNPDASRLSFELVTKLVSPGPGQHITIDNSPGIVMILDEFATASGTSSPPLPERGRQAIELLASLTGFLPITGPAQTTPVDVWKHLYLPLLSSLARQSTNPKREIRHIAVSQLQRILLGPQILLNTFNHSQVEDIFNRVMFPLMDDLLKPHVIQRDPKGMPDTRLRASVLLCKSFVHLEVRENQTQVDFKILWIQILDLLDRFMSVDKADQLFEAFKNAILVLGAAGILLPPSASGEDTRDERQKSFWNATHERIERFLPKFLDEIIPATQG